jgi:hypothetical protein
MAKTSLNLPKLRGLWAGKSNYDKFIIIGSVLFLGVAAFFIVLHRVFFTPDQFYALGFVFALITGQARAFLWDWTPMVLLIFAYEYFRGLIPLINHHIHFDLMPRFDVLLFGRVPAVVLQKTFYSASHVHWYDYAAVILYLMHFLVPLIVGYFFWESDRPYFKEYVIGIVALSYLTFLTYLIFPAAPPWMASQQGIIPPIQHITNDILSHLFNYISLPSVYRYFGDNLTAAVPSLHAAYPLLTALFLGKKYPKLRWLLALYVLAVWFAVMYLGEHYFFDIVVGSIYALFVYAVCERANKYLERKKQHVARPNAILDSPGHSANR